MELRWLALLLAVVTVLRHGALALPPPLSAFHAFTVCDLESHLEVTGRQVSLSCFSELRPFLFFPSG